jgi:hypothetical protein
MLSVTISNGSMCMDGGSVYLEAADADGRQWKIYLDWSIAAQQAGSTSLSINCTKLQAGSAEEAEWTEALRCAHLAGAESTPPSAQKPIVLAPDAKAYIDAMDKGPRSALLALRDDLLRKLESPQHTQQLPASKAPERSGPLPLP